jgi:oxygen-dependent protoporphyrinogen oxidase
MGASEGKAGGGSVGGVGVRRSATVIGGGIAGLSAALRLAQAGAKVTLIEGSARLGGKLLTVDGREAGAENFLMRDPAGGPSAAASLVQELAQEFGLEIVHPSGVPAALYVDGSLKPLPAGTILGIPGPQTDLTGVAVAETNDQDTGKPVLAQGTDVSVGEIVRDRLGDEIVRRLVDPLLGGVYAGHADQLSLAATMPGLHKLLQTEHTLSDAVARAMRPSDGGPIFGTVAGGLSRLVDAIARRLETLGATIWLGTPVRALSEVDADGVVLAVPGGKAKRLLPLVPELDYASVALVSFVFPEFELPGLSGFLAPEGEGVTIKAATFFTRKWAHLPQAQPLIRVSLGRAGAAELLQRPDPELVEIAYRDLSIVLGGLDKGELGKPLKTTVQRWGGGLPQYPPGHVTRVAEAREALRGTNIALAGAAYDGVGIPACVKSGSTAAQALLEGWNA